MAVPAACTLNHLLDARASDVPDDDAFVFWAGQEPVDRLSFAQLAAAARGSARRLVAGGAVGRPVLLMHPPGLDFLVDLFGCFYAGAIAVPAMPPGGDRDRERLAAIVDAARPALGLLGPQARDEQWSRWTQAFPDIPVLRSVRETAPAAPAVPLAEADPLAPAVIQFTSGSSAAPKGVPLSHRAILHNLRQIHAAFDFRRTERPESVVLWLPHFHDMGLFGRLECVFAACSCHLLSPAEFVRRPQRWIDLCAATRATVTGGPSFAFDLAAEAQSSPGLDLSHLRVVFCGAEPISELALSRFERRFLSAGLDPAAVVPCYGMAEATLMVSCHAPSTPRRRLVLDRPALEGGEALADRQGRGVQAVGCGHVCPGTDLAIVDPATHRARPDRIVGEIWIRGASVATRYVRGGGGDDAEDFACLDPSDGGGAFLRTGDLGFLDAGELYVVGRRKALIIVNGRNLHPHDLERAAEGAHPDVAEARAFAFPLPTPRGERPALLMEMPRRLAGGDARLPALAQSIRDAVRDQCDVDPCRVILARRGAIVWTTSGKIARAATAGRIAAGEVSVLAQWPVAGPGMPAGGVAGHLGAVVAEVLARPSIDIGCGVLTLGGDSLAAIRIGARARALYGALVDEGDLFADRPIRAISADVDRRIRDVVAAMSEAEVREALARIEPAIVHSGPCA